MQALTKANSIGSLNYEYVRYTLVKDLQGNVIGLADKNGNLAAKYTYDAWGNILSVTDGQGNDVSGNPGHIANVNPLRYRGYYFDQETGFYYLHTRYYDPKAGRFINADDSLSGIGGNTTGNNLFTYCFNNYVNLVDSTGHWPQDIYSSIKKAVTIAKIIATAQSSHDKNRRPNKGKPGSTFEAPNGDKRTYGPDSRPARDYDHDDHGQPEKHPHDENGGHYHDWDWSKSPPRGDAYAINLEVVAGIGLVAISVVAIVLIVADDATGVGIIDNFLLGPLGTAVGQGVIIIMGGVS